MNMSKSRDIQAKMPSPKVIYASNESKSVLARNLEECRDNDKNSQSVILSFKCILARNCEGTEQLQYILSLNSPRYPRKRDKICFANFTCYRCSRQGLVQALTLTRCSRKNQNWSTGPIKDMQCKKATARITEFFLLWLLLFAKQLFYAREGTL